MNSANAVMNDISEQRRSGIIICTFYNPGTALQSCQPMVLSSRVHAATSSIARRVRGAKRGSRVTTSSVDTASMVSSVRWETSSRRKGSPCYTGPKYLSTHRLADTDGLMVPVAATLNI